MSCVTTSLSSASAMTLLQLLYYWFSISKAMSFRYDFTTVTLLLV
jgi:hypothetical protein